MKRLLLVVTMIACGGAAVAPPKTTAQAEDPMMKWDATAKAPLAWSDFDAKTFTRAKGEKKFIVMDGSAEWCHWCHVMEAVTYHDPAVREVLDKSFIAAKVDVDARPDIEERYAEYGWPATVIFSPDGKELGKYKGFIAPDRFLEILKDVVAGADSANAPREDESTPIPDAPIPDEMMAFIERSTILGLDDYWDDEQSSWGHQQKVPLYMTNAWALVHQEKRALASLDQQIAITDPVWGGIYQYSTDGDWKHPHFEKLMTYNAGALDNYSAAYVLTKQQKYLDVAAGVRKYIDRFLSSPEGGFYVTQDADANAHEVGKKLVTGHEYYGKPEAERLALGIPRVDSHEYPRENGMAIAAYCTYSSASGDSSALDRAKKAADRILATKALDSGGLVHGESLTHAPTASGGSATSHVIHLSDNAWFAWGLLALGRNDQAAKIADVIMTDLEDARGGGFFGRSKDPDAVGVFAVRRKPFEDNVVMLRVLAKLSKAFPDRAPKYKRAIQRTLRAIATPDKIHDRGRMIGDFLLALDETKGYR